MQCPGQDNRYWDGEAVFEIPCPHCGNILEFFKDDSQRSCKQCGKKVLNPRIDFGCAAYCSHAEQCLGSMPPELLAKQKNLFKDKLAIAVRKHLVGKEELFKQATIRTEFAEQVCEKEQRGFLAAVVAAALLLDCANPKELLLEMKADDNLNNAVMALITDQMLDGDEAQASVDIFHDACLLTDIQMNGFDSQNQSFKTDNGREINNQS
jgi:hypothetical protein